MIAVGTVVVMVLAVLGWFQLRDRITDQGIEAADTCVEGDRVVDVTADPDIAEQLVSLADQFTDTRPVVRDSCISVRVTASDSGSVADGLASDSDTWDEGAFGPRPALWVPRSTDVLSTVPGDIVDGTPKSLATSPIVLAGPQAVIDALGTAGVRWTDLPGLQSAPNALDSLIAPGAPPPGWGGARMALPVGATSPATAEAVGAIVDGTAPAPLTDVDDVRREPVLSALTQLASTDRGTAAVLPESTDAALNLLAGDTSATADFHLAPVSRHQFDAVPRAGLGTYAPAGSSLSADYPAAVLSGLGTDETSRRAAAQFVDFARLPENRQVFADSGFDSPAAPADADATASSSASPDIIGAALAVLRDPPTQRRVTVLLDISGSMDATEGSATRLQNTTGALVQQFDSVTDSSAIGLWVYSDDLDGDRAFRTVVPTGRVDEPTSGGTRRDDLIAGVQALEPATATSTYESVTAAFMAAQEGFVPGEPNRLLLVTDGPNDDDTITSERFLSLVSAMLDPTRPVAIDVVSIGTNSDIGTLQSMSDLTGGTLTTVDSSTGSQLPDILRKLLY